MPFILFSAFPQDPRPCNHPYGIEFRLQVFSPLPPAAFHHISALIIFQITEGRAVHLKLNSVFMKQDRDFLQSVIGFLLFHIGGAVAPGTTRAHGGIRDFQLQTSSSTGFGSSSIGSKGIWAPSTSYSRRIFTASSHRYCISPSGVMLSLIIFEAVISHLFLLFFIAEAIPSCTQISWILPFGCLILNHSFFPSFPLRLYGTNAPLLAQMHLYGTKTESIKPPFTV